MGYHPATRQRRHSRQYDAWALLRKSWPTIAEKAMTIVRESVNRFDSPEESKLYSVADEFVDAFRTLMDEPELPHQEFGRLMQLVDETVRHTLNHSKNTFEPWQLNEGIELGKRALISAREAVAANVKKASTATMQKAIHTNRRTMRKVLRDAEERRAAAVDPDTLPLMRRKPSLSHLSTGR